MSIEYIHPSAHTRIIDKSFVGLVAQGQTAMFAPHFSARGRDNVIVEYNSDEEFIQECGEPNIAKYGQINYNIIRWLQNGGKVFGLRLLPEDAKYANVLLSVNVSNKELSVKAEPNTANVASLGAMRAKLDDTVRDFSNGTSTASVPVGFIYPKGRGAAYNGLGVRITLRDSEDNDYTSRLYNIVFTERDRTGSDVVVEGPFIVSFDPDLRSRSTGESLFWENVVNKYSRNMRVMARRDAFDKLATFVHAQSAQKDDPEVSPMNVDILFGVDRKTFTTAKRVHDGVTFGKTDFTDVTKTVYLGGGDDGQFNSGNSKESLMVKAFQGLVDPAATDKWQYEVDVVLDGNLADAVKNAIAEYASNLRGDCVSIVDTGIQVSPDKALEYRKNKVNYNSPNVAVFAQHLQVFDAHTGESIQVTPTYFLASTIPSVDNTHGIQYPFVGPRRGTVSGFESISWVPNEPWKENLYKAQVNYIERDPRQTNFGSQRTTQIQNSALSDINNVRVLMRIKRDVEREVLGYRFEFNSPDTRDSMNYSLNQSLQRWVANGALETISANVYASEYDRQQRIVRVRIELKFTGVLERIFTDIIVNR